MFSAGFRPFLPTRKSPIDQCSIEVTIETEEARSRQQRTLCMEQPAANQIMCRRFVAKVFVKDAMGTSAKRWDALHEPMPMIAKKV